MDEISMKSMENIQTNLVQVVSTFHQIEFASAQYYIILYSMWSKMT